MISGYLGVTMLASTGGEIGSRKATKTIDNELGSKAILGAAGFNWRPYRRDA
jgi:hypothetical protein